MNAQRTEDHGRRLAVLVRELLARESFETLADLTDALKTRCARLHLPCSPEEVTNAFRLVGSNHPLLAGFSTPGAPVASNDAPVSPDEARRILQRIRDRLGVPTPLVKPMPKVRQLTDDEIRARHFRQSQRRAFQLVQQEILDTAERVEQLEDKLTKEGE